MSIVMGLGIKFPNNDLSGRASGLSPQIRSAVVDLRLGALACQVSMCGIMMIVSCEYSILEALGPATAQQ